MLLESKVYSLVSDVDKLNEFIDWLPDLEDGEVYFLTLFARKKWFSMPIKGDKAQLKRFYSDKQYLLRKIRQLEVKFGAYKFDDYEVPNEALGVYISVNPRSYKKAMFEVSKELMVASFENKVVNPVDISLTAIQRNSSKRRFAIYDFDGVTPEKIINEIKHREIINLDALSIVKTRGGFHLFVNYSKMDHKYKNPFAKFRDLEGVDINASGDCLTPLVGCFQGGFSPYLIKNVEEIIQHNPDFSNMIGKTIDEVIKEIPDSYTYRIMSDDSGRYLGTLDLNFKRINFQLVQGVINNVYIG